jgi:hypothetical protein
MTLAFDDAETGNAIEFSADSFPVRADTARYLAVRGRRLNARAVADFVQVSEPQ